MRRKTEVTTMEHYMDFLENPHSHNLTNSCLNQIIHMHGFKKIHKKPKIFLLDTLNSMDLVPPCRSTLQQSIAASDSLAEEEVVGDLVALNWGECPVQSVQAFNAAPQPASNTEYNFWGNDDPTIGVGMRRQRGMRQRRGQQGEVKKRSLGDFCYAPAPSTSTVGSAASSYWLRGR